MKKVTIQLTWNELLALNDTIGIVFEKCPAQDWHDRLIQAVMIKFYARLQQKTIIFRRQFTVSMEADIAASFVLFFANIDIIPSSFAGNIINKIIAKIDKTFA